MLNALLASYDKHILVETNNYKVLRDLQNNRFAGTQVPGFSFSKDLSNTNIDFKFSFLEKGERAYFMEDFENNKMVLKTQYEKKISFGQLTWLFAPIFEYLHQKQNRFSLHAAAYGKKKEAIVYVSEGGGGKTTSSLEMCLNRDFEFIGDERILVDSTKKPQVLCGNPVIHVRKETLPFFSKLNTLRKKAKVYIYPEEVGIIKKNYNYSIKHLVFSRLSTCNIIKKINKESAILNLFKNASEVIRRVGCCIVSLNIPLNSLDTKNLTINRWNNIVRVFSSVEYHMIEGSKDFIGGYLESLL